MAGPPSWIELAEALDAVLSRAQPLAPRLVGLAEAAGGWLAESVTADLDLPPFPKALVDGYAIRSNDFASVAGRFRVVEVVAAGQVPRHPLAHAQTILIMTGAPLPEGADAVVMREDAWPEPGDWVTLSPPRPVASGQNWLPRGREMRVGDPLLGPGIRLGPAQIGLLASAGRRAALIHPQPRVVVVPTGDELVEPGATPGPGQIRNSNGPLLAAFLAGQGAEVEVCPIVPDDAEALRRTFGPALATADVLIAVGGVSAGDLDLVPSAFEALGVAKVFHKVRLKPGKPLWFGIGPSRGSGPGPLVFGLPGNPVGAAVGAALFAGPALRRLKGEAGARPVETRIELARDFTQRGDRPTYHPARLRDNQVEPLDWAGSADLRTLAGAEGFAVFPPGDRVYSRGELVGFLAFA